MPRVAPDDDRRVVHARVPGDEASPGGRGPQGQASALTQRAEVVLASLEGRAREQGQVADLVLGLEEVAGLLDADLSAVAPATRLGRTGG